MAVENDLADFDLDLFKTRNRSALAQSRLKSLIYHEGEGEITLVSRPSNASLTASPQETREAASRNREDTKASQSRMRASEEETEIAKSGFYPRLSVEGSYIRQKETTYTRPEVWALTGLVDWPLFEWNKTRAEVRKREALAQRQKYEHDEVMRTVMLQAEESWRLVKDSEKEVETREKKLRTAEYKLRRAMDRYAEKAIRLADLLESEAEMTRAYNEKRRAAP